nr:MAG TPA_asm: hypothetical protein [Caudoviricetes sp.]
MVAIRPLLSPLGALGVVGEPFSSTHKTYITLVGGYGQ